MSESWVEETRSCPGCGSEAEPEDDGEVRYWACPECGYEFGYLLVRQDNECQLGVPVQVRRAAPASRSSTVTDLGLTIRRRSES